MKKLLLLSFFAVLSISISNVSAQDVLINESVLEMMELGFDQELIIGKIQSSKCKFDTSIESLKELKDKGVPSAVIAAMLETSKKSNLKAKTGIFFLVDKNEQPILPTVFSGTRTNTAAAAFSYGIASVKVKSIVSGLNSPNVISSNNLSFIFYFDANESQSLGQANWWFRTSKSPNDFALVRFKTNKGKNCRELEVASANAWSGGSTGVKDKLAYPVTIEQKEDGVFVVTPESPLEPGEYCFYYKGIIPQGGYNNQSAFDFSVTE